VLATRPKSPLISTGARPTVFSRGGERLVRCPACSKGLHPACIGPPCRCNQCQGKRLLKNAYDQRNSVHIALVRAALDDCLALLSQRAARTRLVQSAAPVDQGECSWPTCTDRCIGSPYGRRKRYCSSRCLQRAKRARRRRAALSAPPSLPMPARWESRAQFDGWWQAENGAADGVSPDSSPELIAHMPPDSA
jgi:hypothetical protein